VQLLAFRRTQPGHSVEVTLNRHMLEALKKCLLFLSGNNSIC